VNGELGENGPGMCHYTISSSLNKLTKVAFASLRTPCPFPYLVAPDLPPLANIFNQIALRPLLQASLQLHSVRKHWEPWVIVAAASSLLHSLHAIAYRLLPSCLQVLPHVPLLTEQPFCPSPWAINTHLQTVLGFLRGISIDGKYRCAVPAEGGASGQQSVLPVTEHPACTHTRAEAA